jgi:hypothetical protein
VFTITPNSRLANLNPLEGYTIRKEPFEGHIYVYCYLLKLSYYVLLAYNITFVKKYY